MDSKKGLLSSSFLERLKRSLALRIFSAAALLVLLSSLLTNLFAAYVLFRAIQEDRKVRFRLVENEIKQALREAYFNYSLQSLKGGSPSEIKLLAHKEALDRIREIALRSGAEWVVYVDSKPIAGNPDFLRSRHFVSLKIPFPPFEWTVFLGFPRNILGSALGHYLILYLFSLLTLVLLGIGLSYAVYVRSIRRPLRKLLRELEVLEQKKKLSPVGIWEVDRLVEEINRAFERERKWLQRLAFSEKMSGLGTLAGGYAHEFNNLLQAISGSIQLAELLLKKGETEKALERLDIAKKAIFKGKKISERLLRLTRRPSHEIQEYADLSAVVTNTLETITQGFPKGIKVETHFDSGLLIPLSEEAVQEIVMNLCLNARDAMGREGLLRVEVRREGEKALLVVEDTGPGIPPEIRSRIFEPFFTTKPAGKGTGLGLFVVHQLVTEAGGEILVTDRKGGGARFEIRFPLVRLSLHPRAPSRQEVLQPAFPEKKKALRVLVVDDEESIREGLREYLEMEGCQVATASSAEEALRLLESNNFDFVFCDLYLPEKDGVWLVKEAMARGWRGKMVFITGYAGELMEEVKELIRSGRVEGILRKPFDLSEVRKIISREDGA